MTAFRPRFEGRRLADARFALDENDLSDAFARPGAELAQQRQLVGAPHEHGLIVGLIFLGEFTDDARAVTPQRQRKVRARGGRR